MKIQNFTVALEFFEYPEELFGSMNQKINFDWYIVSMPGYIPFLVFAPSPVADTLFDDETTVRITSKMGRAMKSISIKEDWSVLESRCNKK